MILRPPRSTRTDTLFPYPTLFRSSRLCRPSAGSGDLEEGVDLDGDTARQRYGTDGKAGMLAGIAEHLDHQVGGAVDHLRMVDEVAGDRKSTRLNSSH